MQRPQTGSPIGLDVLRLRRASAYAAGPGLDEALTFSRRLATYGISSAIGYSALPDESARTVADVHLEAFDRLAAEDLGGYVSVKLAALGFDPGLFTELAAAAARTERRLHIDALGPETADKAMTLLNEAKQAHRSSSLGTTLPGRWRRSLDDCSRAIELGLSVRIVKGQWPDDLGGSVEPIMGFLDIVDRVSGYQGGVAIATHDVALLQESLRRLTSSGTPCEAELFLGLPFGGPAIAAGRFGVPVRMYVAYGDAGAGYGVKDLISHPATVWWLVQDLLWGEDKTWRSIERSRTKPKP
jgi:proline dehydrogenase